MEPCVIPGCGHAANGGHGWCMKHYTRWRRHGDPLTKTRRGENKKGPVSDRFWPLVDRSRGPQECWLWTLAPMRSGYGRVTVDGRNVGAHRIAYELTHGPIPTGLEIHHICETKLCVNPAHLEPLTVAEHRGLGWGRTHCPRGHDYTPANTYVDPKGVKVCRTCQRTHYRRNRPKAPLRR